jgi:hypothetical protein
MRQVFTAQKGSAKQRGIPFEFDFATWSAWWSEDNRWARREPEGLCMCRKEDKGPYAPGNVYCASGSQNSEDAWNFQRAEGRKNRRKT